MVDQPQPHPDPQPQPDPKPEPQPQPFGGVKIKTRTVKAKRHVVAIKVTCPADAQGKCVGTLTLKAKKKRLGAKAFGIKPGRTATVRFRLPRKFTGRKLQATAVAKDARGVAVKTPAKLTLKR